LNKEREREFFDHVYGFNIPYEILEHEGPDFLVLLSEEQSIGVEVTEFYSDQTHARLQNIEGYSLDLLRGSKNVYRADKHRLQVAKANYTKTTGEEIKNISVLLHESPGLKCSLENLERSITTKASKAGEYLSKCAKVDLIVHDSSSAFRFDAFEELMKPLLRFIDKDTLFTTKLREIFIITTRKDKEKVVIPLKLNFFLADCVAFEHLLLKQGKKTHQNNNIFLLLALCLFVVGYRTENVAATDDGIVFRVGCHSLTYAAHGKDIKAEPFKLVPSDAGEPLSSLFSECDDNTLRSVKSLVAARENIFTAMEAVFPVRQRP
jgi:hypothetical protein